MEHNPYLQRTQQAFQHKSSPSSQKVIERTLKDQIQQLAKGIQNAHEKNNNQYNKIIKSNPYFDYKIYIPPVHIDTRRDKIKVTKLLLLKQMDILMDEENRLSRQLNKIDVREQQQKFAKQLQIQKQSNHYIFLRNVWKRNIVVNDAEDRLEKLNKSVALIKSHIVNQSKNEQKNKSQSSFHDIIITSSQYSELKEKYERQLMLREDYRYLAKQNKDNNQNQQRVQNLESQNNSLRMQLCQAKDKLRNSQKNAVKIKIKLQQLEEQLYLKQREMQKITKQIKHIYKNQNYTIQIISKQLSQRKQQQCFIDLQSLLKVFQANSIKNILLDENKVKNLSLIKTQNFGMQILKKRDNESFTPQMKRFRSTSQLKIDDFKITKFIRAANWDDNKNNEEKYKKLITER